MATVLHGRRKGESRYHAACVRTDDDVGAAGERGGSAPVGLQINAHQLQKTTVLSKADWNRINYQLHKKQIEEEQARAQREEEERRKQQSKEIVKHWTNTIAGQRMKKLEARKLREEAEEQERQKIDIEEAQYQAMKRKEAIEKAKTQQYYQSDRVKQFHGALLLTEVLREREAQLELARLKANANQGRDTHYLAEARRLYDEGVLKDQAEARMRRDNAKNCAEFQKNQIRQHLGAVDQEQDEEVMEGQELKALAMQHEMEKRQIDEIRRQEQLELLKDNMQQIQDVKRMKQINQQLEDEEDDECRQFANAKRKMMILRSEKEKQLHSEKQANLEQIREKLAAQMKLRLDDEDDRIRNAIDDAEAKRGREEQEKQEKVAKLRKEMLDHTHEQMRLKEEEARLNRRKEMEMLYTKIEADELFRRNEEEKRRLRKDADRDLMHFHSKQMNDRLDKARHATKADKELAGLNLELINMEEQQFQDYATRVIDHCSKRGRNLYPLKKAAREGMGGGLGPVFPGKGGIRPSYMTSDKRGVQLPHYARDSTAETKTTIEGDVATQKRLGFVW